MKYIPTNFRKGKGMLASTVSKLGEVSFPTWTGLQIYMTPIRKGVPLPNQIQGYTDTVNQILANVDTDEEMYLMIDEKFVKAGDYHRRPGKHVDGYWIPSMQMHGGGGPKHSPFPSPGRHSPGRHTGVGSMEGLLLASNTGDAMSYVGEYSRDFVKDWRGGDCSSIDTASLMPVYMEPNLVYAANVMTVHESLPVKKDCFRSLVRINIPNWSNQ